jgi:hypothetical protein
MLDQSSFLGSKMETTVIAPEPVMLLKILTVNGNGAPAETGLL